ncbi:SWIM zinc finger family protein [Jeotgalibacillus sp. ET6]|uniref:SWIM zinc finger family protein n=1 Tax=Jeotgalibacillus sp. ET6 TaxID=3037260 RepID=UPI00241829EC|nr:SWIM zinc finger family protein [Jeotgalibacillus sp. ET6]MDG5471215.1 SWIM zinc finger family protein [Jeotgalibacillus sp. ET6]
MSFQSQSFTSGIEKLEQKLFQQFMPSNQQDERLIQKGLFLYRQGTVYDGGYDPSMNMLRAKVRDVYQVNVRISLDPEKSSSCSCPEENWCRHRMAVFFKFYQQTSSVSQWITKWRNQKPAMIKIEKSPQAWKQIVKEAISTMNYSQLLEQPFLFDHYIKNAQLTIQKKTPMEKEWKPLYELHSSFWLFIYVSREIHSHDPSVLSNESVMEILGMILEEMEDALSDLAVYARPFAFDPFLEDLRTGSHELLEAISSPVSYSVYSLLWFQLFTSKAWREKELDRISEISEEKDELYFARTGLALLLMKNEVWKEQFRLSSPSVLPHAVRWMEWMMWDDRMDAAVTILQELPKKIPAHVEKFETESEKRSFAHWLIRKLETGKLRLHTADSTIAVYESLLPYSARHLGSLLLDAARYKEWVELVDWIGFTPEELELAGFKQLITKRPDFAVPLLHQWVEQLIAGRQRETYRKAVSYLKKLKKIYTQSNQTQKWEHYFDAILLQHRRLRAFHEECRRGKLIHVDE